MTIYCKLARKMAINLSILVVVTFFFVPLLFASNAPITYSTGYVDINGTRAATSWFTTLQLPLFDTSLGTLTGVTITMQGTVEGTAKLVNNNLTSQNAIYFLDVATSTRFSSMFYTSTDINGDPVVIDYYTDPAPAGTNYGQNGTKVVPTLTKVGTAGATWTSGSSIGTASAVKTSSNISSYASPGGGTLFIDVLAADRAVYDGPANISFTPTNTAGYTVSIQYNFVPEPSTYILLGISLGCVGFVRHRMTKQAQPLQTA